MVKYDFLDKITEQYSEATGDVSLERKENKQFNERMLEWQADRQRFSFVLYKELLRSLGIDYNDKGVIEIGKSSLDTVTNKYSRTTIVSPYCNSFNRLKNDNRSFINGNLYYSGIKPVIRDSKKPLAYPSIELPETEYIITHNPYSLDSIKYWYRLPNCQRDILVGVFGDLADRDYTLKIAILEELKNKLECEVTSEYIEKDNKYVYAIASKRRVR